MKAKDEIRAVLERAWIDAPTITDEMGLPTGAKSKKEMQMKQAIALLDNCIVIPKSDVPDDALGKVKYIQEYLSTGQYHVVDHRDNFKIVADTAALVAEQLGEDDE